MWRRILFFSCFLILHQSQAYAQTPVTRLHVAYVAISGTQAALWIAQEAGLFRKAKLETNLIYIPGAAQVIQTMLAGEIQLAAAAPSGVVDVVLGGGDLVTIAGMVNIPAFYLVVRPEINSVQSLRGHAVGVTRFGSSTDFTMRYLLRKAGLEPEKDVPIVQMGGQPELAAGLLNGRIFAATGTPPAMVRMVKGGAKILITPKNIGFRFPHVGIVVRKSYLSSQREIVKNFVKAYCEGVALLAQDKEKSKAFLARYIHSNDPEVLETTWQYGIDTIERVPYPDPEGFKVVLAERARTRPEVAKARPEQFIDDGIIRELDKEGFFKKIYSH